MTPQRDDYLTAEQIGMPPDAVRRRWPHAVEYVALDGRPCWVRDDLEPPPDPSARDDGRE